MAGSVLLVVVVSDFLIRRTVRNRRLAARAAEIRYSELEPDAAAASAPRQTPEATS